MRQKPVRRPIGPDQDRERKRRLVELVKKRKVDKDRQ
jgi:hypothetical protein